MKNNFQNAVIKALEKKGWKITANPLNFSEKIFDFEDENVVAAQKGEAKIAVEIQSFFSQSYLHDFHFATGQYYNYELGLEISDKERKLYMAIPTNIYNDFFQKDFIKEIVEVKKINLLVIDFLKESIDKGME